MKLFGFWLDEAAFILAAGFLAGVAAVDFNVTTGLVFSVCIVLVCSVFILSSRAGLWKFILVIVAVIFAGIWYTHFYSDLTTTHTNIIFGKTISFSAVVTGEPKVSASGKYLVVAANFQKPFAGAVMMLLPPDTRAQDGDTISVTGKISSPSSAGDSPLVVPRSFSIDAYRTGFSLAATLSDFRAAMVRDVNALLPPSDAGFLSAVAFGAKENLDAETANAMAFSGTAFLATLYGMKISILLFAVYGFLLGYLDRRIIFGIAILVAVLFVMMVGAPAAALRAGIMAVVALVARELGGTLVRRNAIAFAALAMALWNPGILADVGFLASFGSVLGILYLAPALTRAFHWDPDVKGIFLWRENVVMNLAAQLAIIPLIVDPVTGFPLISLVSGAVLIIFLPLTMFAGWFTGFAYLIFHGAAIIAIPFIAILAAIQLFLIHFFAVFSFSVPIVFDPWITAFYYSALIWFAWRFRKADQLFS